MGGRKDVEEGGGRQDDHHHNRYAAVTCKKSPPYVWYGGFAATLGAGAGLALFLTWMKYSWWTMVIGWAIGINVAAIILMWWDKFQAKRQGKYRVPEGILIGVALLFGFPGIWAGTFWFHHKTQKREFRIPLYVVTGIDVLAIIGIIAWCSYAAASGEKV